jgi:hypothetical protein
MGICVGPAPLTLIDRLMELRVEHRGTGGAWASGHDAWVEVLKTAHAGQYLISPISAATTLFGMPIRTDDTLPPGTIELRNAQNETLGRIENVGSRPSTGPTTRLERRCGRCNDPLPPGATFCIECGEKA